MIAAARAPGGKCVQATFWNSSSTVTIDHRLRTPTLEALHSPDARYDCVHDTAFARPRQTAPARIASHTLRLPTRHTALAMTRLLLPFTMFAALAAGIKFTKPAAGTTLKAGTAIEVEWQDGGDGPKISDLTTYQLILVGGGQKDAEQQVIKVLTTAGNFALGGNKASGLVELGLPGADKPANA
jgi:hypothetical protein